MKRKNMRKRCLTACLAASLAAFGFGGCAGVEPEMRAYPMAVSADWQNEEYVIIYGMADLPVDTGQGKDAQESGQEQNTGTVFQGKDMDEIHSLYDATQEYELDLGHVQAVILGDSLLEREEAVRYLFDYMENSVVLGKSAYLFRMNDPSRLMELNSDGTIGNYLTGLYDNRSGAERDQPLTLENCFYEWNNYRRLPEIPRVTVEDGQIFLEKTVNEV